MKGLKKCIVALVIVGGVSLVIFFMYVNDDFNITPVAIHGRAFQSREDGIMASEHHSSEEHEARLVHQIDTLWDQLVIVTGLSESTMGQAYGMVVSAQKHMPKRRIIVYDLGIKESTLQQVKQFCNVEVRSFQFSKYPAHVSNLQNNAWKVLIMKETLMEFGAIFYGDSTVRFSGPLRTLFPYLAPNHGFIFHIHSYDPKLPSPVKHQYYFTQAEMFAELGVNKQQYFKSHKAAPHIAVGRLLMINNSFINNNILNPLTQCVLRKTCIDLAGGGPTAVNGHIASALALLVYKNMRFVWTPENRNTSTDKLDTVVEIQRTISDQKSVQMCPTEPVLLNQNARETKRTEIKPSAHANGDNKLEDVLLNQIDKTAQLTNVINQETKRLEIPTDEDKVVKDDVKSSNGISNTTVKYPHETELDKIIDFEREEVRNLEALWDRLVIVAAFSENHIGEAYGMIASAQKHMPDKKIIVYDLGIKESSIPKIKSLCNVVEVRKFDTSKYPPHVHNLHTYSWKVLIIKETLFEFGAIFYGDSSVRFLGSLKTLFPYLHLNHGYMFHIHSYDPKLPAPIDHQYFHTNKAMFPELGVNPHEYHSSHKAAPHISAGRVLMINDSLINEKILKPLTACALREQCIAPKGSRVGQHRFDASALAILVYKNMRFQWTPENQNTSTEVFDKIVEIQRITNDRNKAKFC